MGRKSDHREFLINFARGQLKKIKSDVERRRMMDRIAVLANLYPEKMIQLVDDSPQGRTSDSLVVKQPTLDEQAQAMLKQLNGGDNGNNASGTTDSVPTDRR